MRWNNMEGLAKDDLMVRGRLVEKYKGFSDINFMSKGSSESLIQSMRRCWKCIKVGNHKRHYKLKEDEIGSIFDEKQQSKRMTTFYQ
jgi:hypothetical protein